LRWGRENKNCINGEKYKDDSFVNTISHRLTSEHENEIALFFVIGEKFISLEKSNVKNNKGSGLNIQHLINPPRCARGNVEN